MSPFFFFFYNYNTEAVFLAYICLHMCVHQCINLGVDILDHKVNASSALQNAYKFLSKVVILSIFLQLCLEEHRGVFFLSPMFYDHEISIGRRIDAFELWCWRRLLRVPWTARRSNKSIQKDISPEYSFEGLMLKLKLQYFGHLIRRTDSLEKTLMLRKIEGRRRRGQQRIRWLDGILDSGDNEGQGSLACCSPWVHK